jgi:hypothetical protein
MPGWLISFMASCGFAIAVATLGFVIKMNRSDAKHDAQYVEHVELLRNIPEMREDIATMKEANKVFWLVLGPHMSSILQSPEHLTRDHLMRKLDEDVLTYDEALQLSSLLGHAFDDECDAERKTAVAFKLAQTRVLLSAMDRKRSEQRKGGHECLRQTGPTFSSSSLPLSRSRG